VIYFKSVYLRKESWLLKRSPNVMNRMRAKGLVL